MHSTSFELNDNTYGRIDGAYLDVMSQIDAWRSAGRLRHYEHRNANLPTLNSAPPAPGTLRISTYGERVQAALPEATLNFASNLTTNPSADIANEMFDRMDAAPPPRSAVQRGLVPAGDVPSGLAAALESYVGVNHNQATLPEVDLDFTQAVYNADGAAFVTEPLVNHQPVQTNATSGRPAAASHRQQPLPE
jgi:hypothetical protein